jgi:uncharacterized membrane protein HdeD (DUF308 family)
VASLIIGILLIAMPFAGAIALALWIAAYAFVFGALLIALAFRLRAWMRTSETNSDFRAGDLEQHRAT